jgi:polyhydroxyalkanoate synthesis regulator phasin
MTGVGKEEVETGVMMNDEKRQILEMVASGKITAEEAEKLLDALGSRGADKAPSASPKYLRIIIEGEEGAAAPKLPRINVRVPVQLLRAGVRLASLLPNQARNHVNKALKERGVNVDLAVLNSSHLDELLEQMTNFTLDVKDTKNKVRIFCE